MGVREHGSLFQFCCIVPPRAAFFFNSVMYTIIDDVVTREGSQTLTGSELRKCYTTLTLMLQTCMIPYHLTLDDMRPTHPSHKVDSPVPN